MFFNQKKTQPVVLVRCSSARCHGKAAQTEKYCPKCKMLKSKLGF